MPCGTLYRDRKAYRGHIEKRECCNPEVCLLFSITTLSYNLTISDINFAAFQLHVILFA